MSQNQVIKPQKIIIDDKPKLTGAQLKQYLSYALIAMILAIIVVLWIKRTLNPNQIVNQLPPDPIEQTARKSSSGAAQIENSPVPREKPQFGDPESWLPQLEIASVTESEISIESAQKAMEEGRIYKPAGRNALQIYLEILKKDPQQPEALQGLSKTTELLIESCDLALSENRLFDAIEILPYLTLVAPENEQVARIKSDIQNRKKVEQLLAQAKEDLANDRLALPEDDSALFYFRKTLDISPENDTALLGLNEIETRLMQKALQEARKQNFEAADQSLDLAETVHGNSLQVTDMRSRIATIRTNKRNEYLAMARQSIEKKVFKQALSWIEQAEAIGIMDAATLQSRALLANAKLYGMHYAQESFRDDLGVGLGTGPEMIVIPIGDFNMGAKKDEPKFRKNELPQHRVRFRKGFAMAKTEITVGQFRKFIQATQFETDADKKGSSTIYRERTGRMQKERGVNWRYAYNGELAADGDPVMHISHRDATAFAEWLTKVSNEPYRLPSEAEFEYVASGGTNTPYWWGNSVPTEPVTNVAGTKDESRKGRNWRGAFKNYSDGYWGPAPAGHFRPNQFGVFDTLGNLSEWVTDCWHDSFVRAPQDGSAWVNAGCENMVIKGGSWASPPDQTRRAYRLESEPGTVSNRVGFRVVRDL